MKRFGYLYQKIIDQENLVKAHQRARKGKTSKAAVRYVDEHLEECIELLHTALKNHTYRVSDYRTKIVYEPKERTIYMLPYFPDCIVQHAILLVLEDIWDKRFLYQSYSCRKGKGQHRASALCMQYVRRYKYVLKCDISKFFYSIPHTRLKSVIRRKIKCKETLALLDEIIDSINRPINFAMLCVLMSSRDSVFDTWFFVETLRTLSGLCGKNTPIGNYLSQWFGNLYLNELDTVIKHKYRVKAYLRYCDDFLLFGDDEKSLNEIKCHIRTFVEDALYLKLSKSDLFPVTRGVDFLGYRHFPQGYILIRKSTAKRQRKNIKAIMYQLRHGLISTEQALSKIASVWGWMKWANTHNLQLAMQLSELEKEIMSEEVQRNCKS